MRTYNRKEFLRLVAASGAGIAAAGSMTGLAPAVAFAQTTNFTSIALDPNWRRSRSPSTKLFGATGVSLSRRTFEGEGVDRLPVLAQPSVGPYLLAVVFGGVAEQAIYRQASIELQLSRIGTGLHVVELFLGDLYPYPYYDATPVPTTVTQPNGMQFKRTFPRLAMTQLPDATIQIRATYGGSPVDAFNLELPHFHTN